MVEPAKPMDGSASEDRYRHVFEDGPIGIWLVDRNLRTLEMNAAMSRMVGYTNEELGERTFADITHPDDLASNLALTAQLFAGELSTYTIEKRYVTKGGDPISVDITVTAVRDDADEFSCAIAVVRDVSERRRAEKALADRGRHLTDAEALAHAGSFTSDPRCDDIEWSDELYRVFGIEPQPIEPTLDLVFDMVHPDDLAVVKARITTLIRTGEPFDMEYRINRPDVGAAPPGGYVCVPMAQGEALGLLHLQTCMTDVRRQSISGDARQRLAISVAEHLSLAQANFTLRESLRNQSIRDSLTGLFNRRYMDEPLQRELARAGRNHSSVAVLAIDVDHFKAFNDAHGHPTGDALLTGLAALLRDRIRSEDIACRSGGEEFNVILPDCGREAAVERADELRVAVKGLQVGVRGRSYGGVTISVGVAAFPEDGADSGTLLQEADAALYRAKAEGRDRVCASPVVPSTVKSQASSR